MSLFMQGVSLSVLGISITFCTLGILVLVMKLLQYFCNPRPSAAAQPQVVVSVPAQAKPAPENQDQAREITAIAAAMAYLRALGMARSGLGASLTAGPTPWWTAGQIEQLSATAAHKMEGE